MQPRLELRLSQRLAMTPQLQQSIKLLQLSRLELQDALLQQMEDNPVLEEVVPGSDSLDTESGAVDEASGPAPGEAVRDETIPAETMGDEAAGHDATGTWDEVFNDTRTWGRSERTSQERDDLPAFEQTTAKTTSLDDHLRWQLALSPLGPREQEIGASIIGNLDEDGYLRVPLEDLAAEAGLSDAQALRVLKAIQAFDPVGVAARDLRECLLAQIEQLGLTGTVADTIIRTHLQELERKRFAALAKTLRVSVDAVTHAVRIIEGLEPKPGRPFFMVENHAVVPDVSVVKVDGQWVVWTNEDGLPKFKVSADYRLLLADKQNVSDDTRAFLDNKFRAAQWLIRAVEQRHKTIVRVVERIVQVQEPFFEMGVSHVRPMVLRDVADALSLHESTVSRATDNKYLHCAHGLFPLKFFFNARVTRSLEGLADLSSVAVREMIRKMIADEDRRRPLTDQDIAARLTAQNITLARRTVAKYRIALTIPPAGRRKRPG